MDEIFRVVADRNLCRSSSSWLKLILDEAALAWLPLISCVTNHRQDQLQDSYPR